MTKTFRLMMGAAVIAAGALAFGGAATAAPHGVKVGTLTCNVSSGWGFVFGSSKDLHCTFRGNHSHGEHYTGVIQKFGVDIGYTEGGVLVWGVFAPASDIRQGALEGEYAGATASATVGVGLGANVLIGGLDKSIALQPLSVEGNQGLNVAAGVGAITLKSAP
jgi:subtilisin family serine protease